MVFFLFYIKLKGCYFLIYQTHWLKEIQTKEKQIKFWHLICQKTESKYAQFQLTKNIAYSTIIVRKIFEAEKREANYLAEARNEGYFLWLETNPSIKNKTICVLVRENVQDEGDTAYPPLKDKEVAISTIVSKIIHDNDWIFWHDAKSHRLNGFRVASEKGDTQYFISIQNWTYILNMCKEFYKAT